MAELSREIVRSERLNEQYTRIEHASGLTLLLCPMEGFSGAYALFGTKYGSVDAKFKTQADADYITIPEGVAHFLEHKLFESEDGDAFTLYAKTGASANAYTSFDRTAYLFSCTENFAESIDILLSFVTNPYFTAETVQKEQGIIGQEIKMYEDSADWRVFFNLLGALYHYNHVKYDIAGTVESIAKIDADLLYRCYNTFYNLHNMVLSIAGNFEIDTVLEAADRILKPAPAMTIDRWSYDEPASIVKQRVEQTLPVALPLFHIGFKGQSGTEKENALGQILDELLMDIIAGEASPLYRRLYDAGLINQTFSCEAMAGRDYTLAMFTGESRDPDKVYSEILAELARYAKDGIDEAEFLRCKKALYGHYVGGYGKVDSVASLMLTAHFYGLTLYEMLETVANITLDQLTARLAKSFEADRSAVSVVKG
jgi:predicted Zn-dependent peptidase